MQGWRPDSTFVVGNTLYSQHLDPRRIGFDAHGNRVAGGMGVAGSAGEWAAAAEILLAQGYEAYAFTLMASLAAPLLGIFKDSGLAVAIQFPERSGRELMVQALTSPWGNRDCLTLHQDEALDQRLRSYKLLGSLPAYYEDLLRLDPYTRQQFIPETLHESRLLFCCNTEALLPDDKAFYPTPGKLRSTVLEISSYVPEPARLDEKKVRLLLNRNYGHAGPRFYQYCVRNVGAVKDLLLTLEDRFWQDIKRAKMDMRPYSALLAAVSAAALIASKTRLLPITPERLTEWMLDRIRENQHGHPAFVKTPEEVFAEFMWEQDQNLAIVSGDDDTWRKGFKKYLEPRANFDVGVKLEYLRNRVVITNKHFTAWAVAKGHRPLHVRKWLRDSGIMLREFAANINARMSGRKSRYTHCMVLDARAHVCRKAILEWCRRNQLDLPPHDREPVFVPWRERRLRLALKADTPPDAPPPSPAARA